MDDQFRFRALALVAELAKELNGVEDLVLERAGANGAAAIAGTPRLMTAKAWQRASAIRRRIFDDGDHLFADPGWDILLDLYIEEAEHRSVSVSSACIAAGVPPTTGLRWLDRLQQRGLLTRTPDARDGRKVYIRLTAIALDRISATLDAAVASDRKLGLGRLQPLA
jgi:DNA-binding MarR family transcriptional regulator